MCLPAMKNALPVSETNGDGQQNVLPEGIQYPNELITQAMLAERNQTEPKANAADRCFELLAAYG